MINTGLLRGVSAHLEESAPDSFTDPLDSASQQNETGNAGQRPANLGASALAVSVPEVGATEHGEARTVRQARDDALRQLLEVSVVRCCHAATSEAERPTKRSRQR
jgi:hypothetical protein